MRAKLGAGLCATAWLALAVLAHAEVASELLGLPLADVQFDSDAPVDKQALRLLLPLEVGKPLLAADVQRARELLELTEVFRAVDFDAGRVDDSVVLQVRLLRKRVIENVSVEGVRTLWDRDIRRLVRLDVGMVFEQELLDAAVERLQSHYRKVGFVEATVAAATTVRDGDVDVTIRVEEGPPLLLAAVVVNAKGLALDPHELEEELADLLGKRRSDEAQRDAGRRLLRRLRAAGYYEAHVNAEWVPSSGHQGVLWFDVDTGPMFEVVVRGNEAKDREELLGLIDLQERLIITDGTWRELGRRMTTAYEEAGYFRADVDVKVQESGEGEEATKQVVFEISEGRRYTVESVTFDGNRRMRAERLLDQMETRPPHFFLWNWVPALRSGTLLEDVLQDDGRRVRDFYRREGFESAKVRPADVRVDDESGRIEVRVTVEEGRRTIVETVRSQGLELVASELPRLRTQPGLPFDEQRTREDEQTLERALGRLGYTDAKVSAEVEREDDGTGAIHADVKYVGVIGERREIGTVVVQGNIDTRSRVILRELPFKRGDALNTEALLQGQANVYQLGLFRLVSVRPLPPEDRVAPDVGVRVVERPAGRLEWGGGYNTRDGLGGFVDVGYANLGGKARQLSLRMQIALTPGDLFPDQYLGNLGYIEPRLGGSRWKVKTNLIAERSTKSVDQFNIERIASITSLDRRLRRHLETGVELQAEKARVFNVSDSAELKPLDEGQLRTISLSPFLTWDHRNDPFAPRSGLIDSVRLRYALPDLSTVHFAKVTVRHAHYVPLFDKVRFVYAVRGGWAGPFDGSAEMPIRERFFLGGRDTVRGFSENSIGPKRGKNGDPIGGDVSINVNAEITFPLVYGFRGAAFTDGGALFLLKRPDDEPGEEPIRDDEPSLRNFRRTAGLGVRYATPVGPLSLDYGIKLDRKSGEAFGQVHFSIGTTF